MFKNTLAAVAAKRNLAVEGEIDEIGGGSANVGAGVESLSDSKQGPAVALNDPDAEPADRDTEKGKDSEAKPEPRFGAVRMPIKVPNEFPYVVEKTNPETKEITGWNIYIVGEIATWGQSEIAGFHNAIHVLNKATADQEVCIWIDSQGGEVSVTTALVSAIMACKGKVVTIAMGIVASAATVIWGAGSEKRIMPAATFMFHHSYHFMSGRSNMAAHASRLIAENTEEFLLVPFVAKGILTEDEISLIKSGCDVFFPGAVIQARMDAAHAATVEEEEAPADAAPATPEEPDALPPEPTTEGDDSQTSDEPNDPVDEQGSPEEPAVQSDSDLI